MTRGRLVLCLLTLTLAPGLGLSAALTVAEDEEQPKPTQEARCVQLARAVLAAAGASDQTTLAHYRRIDIPDPWVACLILCAWGEAGAARTWVDSPSRMELRSLPAQIEQWAEKPLPKSVLATITVADDHFDRRRWLEAATAYETLAGQENAFVRGLGQVRLGIARHWLGLDSEAVAPLRDGLAAATDVGWWEGAAQARWALGRALFGMNQFQGALDHWNALVALLEAFGRELPLARERVDLGGAYGELGDYRMALELFELARPVLYQHGDRSRFATLLIDSGIAHERLGEMALALRAYEGAIDLARVMNNPQREAQALSAASMVHAHLVDEEPAVEMAARAVALCNPEEDPRGLAEALGTQAYVYALLASRLDNDDYGREATALYLRAGAAFRDARDDLGAARAELSLAIQYKARGDFPAALELFRQVEPRLEELGGLVGLSTLQIERGLIHLRRQPPDYEAALKYFRAGYKRALQIDYGYEIVRAAQGVAEVHFRTAMAAARANKVPPDPKALAMAFQEVSTAVKVQTRLVSGLGEEQGARAREPRSALYRLGARIAVARGDVHGLHAMLENGRSLGFLESVEGKEALRVLANRDTNRKSEQEARRDEWIARKRLRAARKKGKFAEVRVAKAALDAATAKTNKILQQVERGAKARSALVYPKPVELDALQATLRPGEAYVAYALLEDEAYALVLEAGKGKEPRIAKLGPTSRIVESGTAALEMMEFQEKGAEKAVAGLRDLLLDPLGLGKGVERLLVSPDGILFQVPLPAPTAGREVVYVASGSVHALLRASIASGGAGILALGDPLYEPDRKLLPLDESRKEVEGIPGKDVERLLGPEATFANLREKLAQKKGRWTALHFGCHGRADPDRPMSSSLEIAADDQHEGTLARDVMLLDVPADLVILSACESGKGRVYSGEGLLGLTRSFMFSGAPRVVCSLWKVDDKATGALMARFYEVWSPTSGKGDVGAAEALEIAQEHVRSKPKWKHPYYWAAWVLWGLAD